MRPKRKNPDDANKDTIRTKRRRVEVISLPTSDEVRQMRLTANDMTKLLSLPREVRNLIYAYALDGFYDTAPRYGRTCPNSPDITSKHDTWVKEAPHGMIVSEGHQF